jgi:hypothetical protein
MREVVSMGDTVTVRERIEEELQADEIHGLTVTRQSDNTVYCVVSQSTTWDKVDDSQEMDIPVLDLRTVVVDLGKETVRVSDNGLWVPKGKDVADDLTATLARTSNDLAGGVDGDHGPLLKASSEDLDPDLLLDREIKIEEDVDGQNVDRMRNDPGIDPSRSWGYGAGPPEEAFAFADRLREAGLNPSDHFTWLEWGKKSPISRPRRFDTESLKGNYGVETNPRPDGFIAIDVDYPEKFPETELPETYEVSSPHGSEEQRHLILRCSEKDVIAEELGAWAVQGVEWGDLWVGDRYVVGPGCQLSEYGCSEGDHERDEPGGCERCSDPDGGYYTVVNDAPIAEVEADEILDLLTDSDDYQLRDRDTDPDPPERENGADGETEITEEVEADPAEEITETADGEAHVEAGVVRVETEGREIEMVDRKGVDGDLDREADDSDGPTFCDRCSRELSEEESKEITIAGEQKVICRGGCYE